VLKLKNITKSFGERIVLDSIDLDIEKGRIHTLIGSNGSGKTTLFNIITGFLKSDAGTIQFNDTIIGNKQPYKINRLGITRTFQDLRLIKNISVRDNIILAFRKNNRENLFNALLPKQIYSDYDNKLIESADAILNEICLYEVANSLAGEISYGQQKLLTIGYCIVNNPDLLL
jgi:branched-chain amino acid transport system ATP-binding protein